MDHRAEYILPFYRAYVSKIIYREGKGWHWANVNILAARGFRVMRIYTPPNTVRPGYRIRIVREDTERLGKMDVWAWGGEYYDLPYLETPETLECTIKGRVASIDGGALADYGGVSCGFPEVVRPVADEWVTPSILLQRVMVGDAVEFDGGRAVLVGDDEKRRVLVSICGNEYKFKGGETLAKWKSELVRRAGFHRLANTHAMLSRIESINKALGRGLGDEKNEALLQEMDYCESFISG